MTAAPFFTGSRWRGSMPAQAAAGAVYISLTMMAPSGTGWAVAGAALASGRLAFSHTKKSGEYQIITGAWVP